MSALGGTATIALPLVEAAGDVSRFGAGEIIAIILGVSLALVITWLGISRARERSYTTTPTMPAVLPERETAQDGASTSANGGKLS